MKIKLEDGNETTIGAMQKGNRNYPSIDAHFALGAMLIGAREETYEENEPDMTFGPDTYLVNYSYNKRTNILPASQMRGGGTMTTPKAMMEDYCAPPGHSSSTGHDASMEWARSVSQSTESAKPPAKAKQQRFSSPAVIEGEGTAEDDVFLGEDKPWLGNSIPPAPTPKLPAAAPKKERATKRKTPSKSDIEFAMGVVKRYLYYMNLQR